MFIGDREQSGKINWVQVDVGSGGGSAAAGGAAATTAVGHQHVGWWTSRPIRQVQVRAGLEHLARRHDK